LCMDSVLYTSFSQASNQLLVKIRETALTSEILSQNPI
jgi:hypothetical protein